MANKKISDLTANSTPATTALLEVEDASASGKTTIAEAVSASAAVTTDTAGEIEALTTVTAVAGDWILIEDASDGDAKKKVDASDFIGGGGSDPSLLSDNTAAAPAYSYTSQTDTGAYLSDTTNPTLGLSVEGADALLLRRVMDVATGAEVAFDFAATVNKATSGDYTGIKLNVTDTASPGTANRLMDLQVGGATQMEVTDAGLINVAANSSVNAVAFGVDTSGDSGLYEAGSGRVGVAVAGTARMVLYSSGVRFTAGSAANPGVSFIDDANTGFWHDTADQINVSLNGTEEYNFLTTGFHPADDDANALGTASLRWSTLHSTTLNTGDIHMHGQHDDAHWTLNESRDGIFVHDRRTGKVYRLAMEPVDPADAPPVTP